MCRLVNPLCRFRLYSLPNHMEAGGFQSHTYNPLKEEIQKQQVFSKIF